VHGLEACPLVKSELSSLDFVVNRFFMKMFRTSNIQIVRGCQSYFGFNFPNDLGSNHVEKFDVKYTTCEGSFVNYGTNVTQFFKMLFLLCLNVLVVSMLSVFLMNKDVYNEFSIPTIYYFPTELQVYHYSILIIIYCTCLRVSGFH